MPQSTAMNVTERASNRYEVAQSALSGMQIDLAELAGKALEALHRRTDDTRSRITVRQAPDVYGFTRDLREDVPTWRIADTRYHLPEWRKADGSQPTPSLEQTLVEIPLGGKPAVITFDDFVKRCRHRDYVAVCNGLWDLAQNT